MKMVIVHHKDAVEPIKVPECDLAAFAEKGWHPVETVTETVDSIDSEEVE